MKKKTADDSAIAVKDASFEIVGKKLKSKYAPPI